MNQPTVKRGHQEPRTKAEIKTSILERFQDFANDRGRNRENLNPMEALEKALEGWLDASEGKY